MDLFKGNRVDRTPDKYTANAINAIWKVRIASTLLVFLFFAIQPWQVAAIVILAGIAIIFWLSGRRKQSSANPRSSG
jgi:hypothetical protein